MKNHRVFPPPPHNLPPRPRGPPPNGGGADRVGRGASLLAPALTGRVLERLRAKPAQDELAQLTDQERRILDLIAEGYTNRQIADTIFLAEKTVKNYVSNLLAKLGMSRRTEAAAYAARLTERRRQEPH